MRLPRAGSAAALGFIALGVFPQSAAPDDELKSAIGKLRHARSASPAESQAAFAGIQSVDYVGVAPDGSQETRAEAVARSEKGTGRSIAIEDERIHVFRDEMGRPRTAIVTDRARHESAHGVSYTQDFYVLEYDGSWLAIAGREMPVTPENVLSIAIDVNARSASSHRHENDPDASELLEQIHKFAWASVLSEPGSAEEEAKVAFSNRTLPADSLRIAEDGSAMRVDQWNRRGAQRAVKNIVYEGVLIHFFGSTAVVTYRSRYEFTQGTVHWLLLRVYLKRAGRWEMIAGQGFPVRQPAKN